MLIKLLRETSKIPERHLDAAGYDLFSDSETFTLCPNETTLCNTGVSVAIPKGQMGMILPKSGLGSKGLILGNTTGIIDSDYRGELKVNLWNRNQGDKGIPIIKGQKIAQLVLLSVQNPELEVTDTLPDTERGDNGFGSSGV